MSKVKKKSVKTRKKRRQRGKEVVRSSEVNLSESLFSPLVKSVRRKRIKRMCRKQVKG